MIYRIKPLKKSEYPIGNQLQRAVVWWKTALIERGMGFRGRAEASMQAGENTPLSKEAYDSMH